MWRLDENRGLMDDEMRLDARTLVESCLAWWTGLAEQTQVWRHSHMISGEALPPPSHSESEEPKPIDLHV
jgi:hypothetical protein